MALFAKPQKEISILLDIGSRGVGAALLKLSHGDKPKIVWSAHELTALEQNLDIKKILDGMLGALKKVLGRLEKEGMPQFREKWGVHSIREIFLVFSSPWYVSQTKIIKIEKEKPFSFTNGFLKDILKKEEKELGESLDEKDFHKTKLHGNSLKLLEQKVIQIKLNGYEAPSPLNKEAKTADIVLYTSFAERAIFEKIKETILHFFHPKAMVVHSAPLVYYSVLRDIFPEENDFMLVDVGDEVTDISLVKAGSLLEISSFPLGHNHIFRGVCNSLNCAEELALSSLSLYFEKKTNDDQNVKISDILEQTKKFWGDSFQHTLENLGEFHSVPTRIYLSSRKMLLPVFAEIMVTKSTDDAIVAKKGVWKPDVVPLDKIIISPFIVPDQNSSDISLELQSLFFDKVFSSK